MGRPGASKGLELCGCRRVEVCVGVCVSVCEVNPNHPNKGNE